MIPYDELCQALERWAALRRNEAEMDALEADGAAVGGDVDMAAAAVAGHEYGSEAYADHVLDHAGYDEADVVDADELSEDLDDVHEIEAQDEAYDETPRSVEVDIDEQAAMDADALTQRPTELVPEHAAGSNDGIGDVPTIIPAEGEAHGDPTAPGYDVNLQAAEEHREGEA
ncbi:MAG: hypothetical protein KC503_35030 [Myxococcales bacterium]|nr:hypothetical protein [Myxococcales bacterium]